ncbi:MAG: MFS transporter [Chloroflexi bacterium]|nr:MFS transporter [Chloroflexota bacterium]
MAPVSKAVKEETNNRPEASRRTITLALVSSAHGVNHAYVPLMPIVWARMMADIGMTMLQLGWMVGVTNIVGGILQLWFGSISRVVKRKDLLGMGSILAGVSTAATGAAANFAQVLWLRLVNRVGGAPQHPCGNSIIAERFERRQRGRALGLNNSVAQVGMVLAPVITAFLIVRFDWRWTLVFFSLPAIVIGILMLTLIREKPRPRSGGLKLSDLGISLTDVKSYFRDRNMVAITGAQFFAAGGRGIGVLLTYVPLYLIQEMKYDTMTVGLLLTAMTTASVAGPFGFGILSDRFGRKKIILICYLFSTLSTVVFALIRDQSWLVPAILFVMGLVVYAESPLQQTWMSDITDEKNRDMNFGIYFTIGYGAGAAWGPVMGWLVQDKGFTVAFYVMALSYVLGGLCLLPAREKGRGE